MCGISTTGEFADAYHMAETGLRVDRVLRRPDKAVREQIFREMQYTGLSPENGVPLVDGDIRIAGTDEYPEESPDPRHYPDK